MLVYHGNYKILTDKKFPHREAQYQMGVRLKPGISVPTMLSEGEWTLTVEVTSGDNVNVENDVTILYPEGSEDSPNPRPE